MIKWEDTVMSDEEATEYIKHFRNVKPNQKLPYHWHRETQAEISFKAGIREVVDWVNKEDIVDEYCIDRWQAKLKEWGLEIKDGS